MNNIKLIATDLDGTLLNDLGEISTFTKTVINQMLKLGYIIVPTTARSYKELPESLLETDLNYYICSNGAIIWDKNQNLILSSHLLPTTIAQEILLATSSASKVTTVVQQGVVYSEQSIRDLFVEYGLDSNLIQLILSKRTLVPSVDPILANFETIDKLHFNLKDENSRDECLKLVPVSEEYTITSSDPDNIEITNKMATKGETVKELSKLLEIDSTAIMAIGDNMNDIPLFDVASIKVAMKNGKELLKEKADFITKYTNEEDGVAKFIQTNFINKI